jgi:hypothetical protein
MPTDRSLRALREASPRSQTGFDQWLDRLDPLREQILMREHGPALAHATPPAHPRRRVTARQRWRLPVLAGGLTAAAAATAAAALVLASGPGTVPGQRGKAGHARTVVTAAWTVHEAADGTVTISLRQYADPAGLQRTLRADGVNAIVRAMPTRTTTRPGGLPGSGKPPLRVPVATCSYAATNNAPPQVQRAAVTVVFQDVPAPRGAGIRIATFIIHPDAMPPGSALLLPFATNTLATPANGYPRVKPLWPIVLNNDTVPACVPVTK